jgi:hypothetical protein
MQRFFHYGRIFQVGSDKKEKLNHIIIKLLKY